MKKPEFYKDALRRQAVEDEREDRERHLASVFETIGEIVLDLEQKWIVDELLPETYLAVLAGPPKSGKTAFATALALAVATGTPFAGRETQQGGVLWIAAEESRPQPRCPRPKIP